MPPRPLRRLPALLLLLFIMPAACADSPAGPPPPSAARSAPPRAALPSPTASTPPSARVPDPASSPPPAWLGTRPLPPAANGYGQVQPTPPELTDRRLWTVDVLPPPPDEQFTAQVQPVPAEVAARSTWTPDCPVALEDLRYVTVAFWGFDGLPHTGELLLHHTVADVVVEVFAALHAARFPLEGLTIAAPGDNDAPPTGDGNISSSFNCRPSRGSGNWSEHAKGLAVDLNPFHNPYVRGDVLLPELAGAYRDREWKRPGMIHPGDAVTRAFAAIGWQWGGEWRRSKDYMHFSASGH